MCVVCMLQYNIIHYGYRLVCSMRDPPLFVIVLYDCILYRNGTAYTLAGCLKHIRYCTSYGSYNMLKRDKKMYDTYTLLVPVACGYIRLQKCSCKGWWRDY